MKNLFSTRILLIRIFITLLIAGSSYLTSAQHIQYRHKITPVEKKETSPSENKLVPVPDKTVKITPPPVVIEEKRVIPKDTIATPIAILRDTSSSFVKSKAAFTMNPRPKKPYVEEQNMCDLMSKPEVAPQLPVIINNVSEAMIKMLKERYKGRLYSITGLNMFDERLKFKLKICDRDQAKFRSEYLDKDGNIVSDPDFDYD